MNSKPKTVRLDAALYDFYLAEAEQIHALCDRAVVPQHLDGESLSISQRVAILEGAYQMLCKKLTGKSEYTAQ